MSKISDELHTRANNMRSSTTSMASPGPSVFDGLADRIDAEMAELPRGKDGKSIRVGETVYGEDGKAWCVRGVVIGQWTEHTKSPVVYATGDSGKWRNLLPWLLTHERPDSWERIAQELDELCDDEAAERRIRVSDQDALRKFAERIRRLAEREGADGTD